MDTLLPHGSLGLMVPLHPDDPVRHRETVAEVEDLGYDTAWIAGGDLDRLDRVDELLTASARIRVGTAIVPLGVHDDDAIVAHHRSVEAAHPGRVVLGLGGPQQARPMAALAEHLDTLDAAGVRRDERLLAALGPRKTEVARDRSAGAITMLTVPEQTRRTRETLGPDRLLVVLLVAVLGEDAPRARDAARGTLGFLSRVAGYRRSWADAGYAETEIDDLADDLVDGLVAHGDEAAIRHRIEQHRAAGADHVALTLFPAEGGPDLLGSARRLALQAEPV